MTSPSALVATHRLLRAFHTEKPAPAEALRRVRALATDHPDIAFDLAWDTQAFDGSVEYQALLDTPGEGATAVSVAPKDGLPWPLRNVHRHDEAELLRVNGVILRIGEAVCLMDAVWANEALLRRLVDACLLREALGDPLPDVPDHELQEAMNAFRRARGLRSAEATARWLRDAGLDQAKLEELLVEQIAIGRLRDRVTTGHVETYFAEHERELDLLTGWRLTTGSAEHCRQVVDRARHRSTSLLDATASCDGDGRAAAPCSLVSVRMRRLHLQSQEVTELHDPLPIVTDPFECADGWRAEQIDRSQPAVLDASTRAFCQERIFRDWLAQRRAAAEIEWFWGTERRPSGRNGARSRP